jgi:hypothetical protein
MHRAPVGPSHILPPHVNAVIARRWVKHAGVVVEDRRHQASDRAVEIVAHALHDPIGGLCVYGGMNL